MTSTTHQTLDTVYSADCVEFCPIPGYHDVVLCGTYQLEEHAEKGESNGTSTPQTRVGRLYVYQLQGLPDTPQLVQWTSLDMPGILDIKWSYQTVNGAPYFALVNSVGELKVFRLNTEDKTVALVTECQIKPDCLGLSLEWNNMLAERDAVKITVSDSTGCLHVYQLCSDRLEVMASWTGHDFEAWITAFDQWNTQLIYSGGDDCKLKGWDMRVGTSAPVFTSKRHTMGVCSVQSNPKLESGLATGSYDEQLLIWDSRQMKQPISELGLGGGVWRIKWEPYTANHILTATMYNGFHIVDTADVKAAPPEVLCHYTEHQSIGYGADWFRNTDGHQSKHFTIATCSFYDHLLKLWTISSMNKDDKT